MTQNKIRLVDLFRFYKGLPHQMAAVTELEAVINNANPHILGRDQGWFKTWSVSGKQSSFSNSWEGVLEAARIAGAKFPELAAAQWALESGYGKFTSGRNNFFGLKGDGSDKKTQEFINNQWVTITDSFIDFPDLLSCVTYLVDHWYKDYKNYKGCNNAATREEAAKWLQKEGYATDPSYAGKLIDVMNRHAKRQPEIQQQPAKLTPASPFSARITPHIRLGEFALDQEVRRFGHQHQVDTAAELAAFMERVRQRFGGQPVIITSGYRPASVNAAVGGASRSEHLYNAPGVGAVDFYIKGADINAVQKWCDDNWPYSLGYGAPKGFVHLGIRAGRPRVRWDY